MEIVMDSDDTLAKEAQLIAMAESPLLARILMQLVNQYGKIWMISPKKKSDVAREISERTISFETEKRSRLSQIERG
ncbi:uncharacterized protein MONOS_15206 [Monocercomonoides exilis]|uniref:uncharacterized protein n=1 Tax=Monocercomonoides exilis TaxID=2049356 RepID=UPI00355ABDC8|nr:hypothetical protein MONOS_15206 [Monocercomonoides exilis]|eukprot:MONOS_15206.1-p1 / transcript=MONOS_15206.1 / gene=MONOS_15206 / organism=Monocercomonoides_exilis_PA203 / gene_product=unspecified product / transcript_product=unspecified product / location=Mono_scaffold01169:13931-14161(+) / protein_length=77 / sequence_SO=supercontig / SO=protein_coding / is_pseudo=false